ncbi:MAG: YdeI/OmpD-associated family protein [Anaerolinea sp.]|nr:YdeI/OmpD-associated family protein [Anaerolinea sp.]
MTGSPVFFATPEEFRAWLEENHATVRELWVGYTKKGAGRPSITWPESVDEALCFGWIDGIRRSVDDTSYMNRFTPRRPGSNWSAVNIARVAELTAQGRMRPAGLAAFDRRRDETTAVYSYEQRHQAALEEAEEQQLRANPAAWQFFQARPPSYRQAAIRWVISAKKAETRQSRLARLIEDSAQGRTVPPLTRPTKAQP